MAAAPPQLEEEVAPRWDGWLGPRAWVPAAVVLLLALAVSIGLFIRERGDAGAANAGGSTHGIVEGGNRQKIHEHADFAVFIRGQQVDFGQPQYVSTAEKALSESVHIHKPRFTVIHIHREQTTWDELFRSLGWELTDDCIKPAGGEKLCNTDRESLKFVVNGVRIDSLMFETIPPLARVLISYGPESDEQVMQQFGQVTDQACIPAGLCLARGNGLNEHGEPEEECTKNDDSCN